MKTGIETLLNAYLRDNQEYIIENEGTVYEYLMNEMSSMDQGINWYLSDEEIEKYESGTATERLEIEQEVKKFLSEYNIDIDEYYS